MADLAFYRSQLGLDTTGAAYIHLFNSLQTYYDANYYVNWEKVKRNIHTFSSELHLLSALCEVPNRNIAVRQMIRDFPRVIRAFPSLMAWRGSISLLEDVSTAKVEMLDFTPRDNLSEAEVERYARFLEESGILSLLSHLKSVPDYVTGVEVGIDTNGRKNRSGNCAIRALQPHIQTAISNLGDIEFWPERNYKWLREQGCPLSSDMARLKWDGVFRSKSTGKWILMEVNHYGVAGSKPDAIADSYIARERELSILGLGFIWVTDGLGWQTMQSSLKRAFDELRYLITIQLARDGLLEWALRSMTGNK